MFTFLSKDFQSPRNEFSKLFGELNPSEFFNTPIKKEGEVQWEWTSPKTAKIKGKNWLLEGVFQNRKLERGRLEMPEVTFEGKFSEDFSVIGPFQKGKISFADGDYADVTIESSMFVFGNYFDAKEKKCLNLINQEVKKVVDEGKQEFRCIKDLSLVTGKIDSFGNFLNGVELSLLGFFRSKFNFLDHRNTSLRNIFGSELTIKEVTPNDKTTIDLSSEGEKFVSFAFEGLPGLISVNLDRFELPNFGQGVYTIGSKSVHFTLVRIDKDLKMILNLQMFKPAQLRNELLKIINLNSNFDQQSDLSSEHVSLPQFAQLLFRYQRLWDNHDAVEERLNSRIKSLVNDNKRLVFQVSQLKSSEKYKSLIEENFFLSNLNQNLKILYNEKEKVILELSRQIKQREDQHLKVILNKTQELEVMSDVLRICKEELKQKPKEFVISTGPSLADLQKVENEKKEIHKNLMLYESKCALLELECKKMNLQLASSSSTMEKTIEDLRIKLLEKEEENEKLKEIIESHSAFEKPEEKKSELQNFESVITITNSNEGSSLPKDDDKKSAYDNFFLANAQINLDHCRFTGKFFIPLVTGEGELEYYESGVTFKGKFIEGLFEEGEVMFKNMEYTGEIDQNLLEGRGTIKASGFKMEANFSCNELIDGPVKVWRFDEDETEELEGELMGDKLRTVDGENFIVDFKRGVIEEETIGAKF